MSTGRIARRRQRRQRRERIGGALLVALGVVVAVVAIVALVHKPSSNSAKASTATRSVSASNRSTSSGSATSSPSTSATASSSTSNTASTSSSTSATASPFPVVVLNNTTIRGLAKRAADDLTAAGYQVTSYGNYQNNIVSTCVYYDPAISGAQAAAEQLKAKFSWIVRTKERFAELPTGPLVLVLTSDIS